MALTIEAKQVGRRTDLIPEWHIPIDDIAGTGGAAITLRDLICRIVESEVASFTMRQQQRRLDRVLSAKDIDRGMEAGRVAPEGRSVSTESVDVDYAVGHALQAFEDGTYYVIIDDERMSDLDQQVMLADDSHVLFLRLVPLAGG